MKVSYKKLFKLLIDRDVKKHELRKAANIFFNSFTKLFNSKDISVDVPVRICIALRMGISNITELIPDEGIG